MRHYHSCALWYPTDTLLNLRLQNEFLLPRPRYDLLRRGRVLYGCESFQRPSPGVSSVLSSLSSFLECVTFMLMFDYYSSALRTQRSSQQQSPLSEVNGAQDSSAT